MLKGWLPTDWESNSTQHEIATTCDVIMAAAAAAQSGPPVDTVDDDRSALREKKLHELAALSTSIYACLLAVAVASSDEPRPAWADIKRTETE